jgi:hypothetical protein
MAMTYNYPFRICPGRYMADNSVFIGVASILMAFSITPPQNDIGNPIPIKEAFTSGLMSYAPKTSPTEIYS